MSPQSNHFFNSSLKSCTKPPTESLIDITVEIIQYIWPEELLDRKSIPLRVFAEEILRRSGASFSILFVTLIYLFRFKSSLTILNSAESNGNSPRCEACRSGRRMFIAAMIVASKYLEDQNIPNTRWSLTTGLGIQEINHNERVFLNHLGYQLYLAPSLFTWWITLLLANADGDIILSFNQKISKKARSGTPPDQTTVIRTPLRTGKQNIRDQMRFNNNLHYLPYRHPKARSSVQS
ncbi:PHO85 cyclin-5 [Basidiobolus ranarum]|uniref:PHO85 cyclin-5 n=1 Tax=Basidiobolus ranarum TaxID=34480 RepID=A0ABR2VR20_9FUNG